MTSQQMYKVPEITQEEAFSLFMRGLEPRIREQVGYHVDGDLGRAMAMAEKADVWRSRNEGQNKQKWEGQGSRDRDKIKKETKSRGGGRRVLGTQSREKGL